MEKLTTEQIARVLYAVDVAFTGEEAPVFNDADIEQCVAAVESIAEGKDVTVDERRAAVMRAVVQSLAAVEIAVEVRVQRVVVNVPMENMVGVKYVGTKPRQVDNLYGTGLEWSPGDVYNVDKAVAAKMGVHTDVYEIVEAVAGAGCATSVAQGSEAQEEDLQPPLPHLEGMNRAELIAYAQRNFNENFAKNMKDETMRSRILGLIQSGKMNAE
jgi:hypothetical protein